MASLSGCSGSGDDGNAATGGSSSNGGTTGSGGSAGGGASNGGSASGGTTSSSGGSDPGSTKLGKITLTSLEFAAGHPEGSASLAAEFGPSLLPRSDCTRQTSGNCYIETCPSKDTPPTSAPQAGNITLQVPTRSFAQTLTPDSGGIYKSWTQLGYLFTGGELLNLSASGGQVPAFSLNTATFPQPMQLTQSQAFLTQVESHVVRLDLSRQADSVLLLQGGASDTILVLQSENDEGAMLVCHVDSTQAQYTVPAGVLAPLPAQTYIDAYVVKETSFKAGDYDMLLRQATILLDGSGSNRVFFYVE